ncbi:amino acid permease-associated region [Natrinema pellirubrum DSM 15624]|uniref:Amino acid permease-associated region n=1 Tax=Natrinema pellirubrum (strain DSM 15624 / CIP 106293 / JCM 10476 / NCIMB 786 / 157) TaxID=797303 RepID=L9Z5H4_NATP1|nr:amino acid permease-associated region [Natrinema pellirubrum DSM 15624]
MSVVDSAEAETEPIGTHGTDALERDIGLLGATAIGTGTMIAGGIFVLSGLAVANVGAAAIVSFGLAAIVASFTALTYAEFATIYTVDGGGYAYVAEVFDSDWSYVVGWLLILGYPASAAFYLASFANWFARFVRPEIALPEALPYWIPGVVVLAILVGVNLAGAEETGRFQIVVTGLKIALIGLFLVGGLSAFDADVVASSLTANATQFDDIALTSALVFITFFGFEAIATSEGEIEAPERTVPRAIFLSIAVVTVLYVLVIVVVVLAINDGSFLSFLAERAGLSSSGAATGFVAERGEVAMARAAQYYLGDAGFYVFIVGALLSMISAANATVLAGSRVKLAMARRDHLPERVQRINPQSGVPTVAVVLTGCLILVFFLLFGVVFGASPGGGGGAHDPLLGLESLAHFADVMLLGGLVFVNIALIRSRRKEPDRERRFRVPGVPWVPLLAIGSNLALLASVELTSLALGTLAVVVGIVLWFGVID